MEEEPEEEPVGWDKIVPGVVRIQQVCHTIRTGFICIAVGWCVYFICHTIIKLADKPAWLSFSLAAIGASAPSGLLGLTVRRFKKYIRLHTDRTKAIESQVDPDRSSSGLMPDGTTPPKERL